MEENTTVIDEDIEDTNEDDEESSAEDNADDTQETESDSSADTENTSTDVSEIVESSEESSSDSDDEESGEDTDSDSDHEESEEETTEETIEETTEIVTESEESVTINHWSNGVFYNGNYVFKDYSNDMYFYMDGGFATYISEEYYDEITSGKWDFGEVSAHYHGYIVYFNYYGSPFYIRDDLKIVWIHDEENIEYIDESASEEETTTEIETETFTEIPFLEKPFAEYTTTEGYLALIFILLLCALLYKILND